MTDTVPVYVQDHSFIVGDSGAATPFETMDYSTGLAGVMKSAAMIYTGIDRGTVMVTVDTVDSRPALDTPQQWAALAEWDDIAEVSLSVPRGDLRVDRLEYGPTDPRLALPSLSPAGPGHYRVRIHARGRDRYYDKVVDDSGETFSLIAWPQPPALPLIIKATSSCGYGLRLNHISAPPHTAPRVDAAARAVTAEQDEAAARQAMLHRALGGT